MLNGIYFIEKFFMDVVSVTLQKGQEERKKKQVLNVQTREVQAQRGKGIHQSNYVPIKVTFKSSSHPK